jgi:ATP-dependent exoDNAse (exonuclease V) alpha subunit
MTYKELEEALVISNKNQLILGTGGSGKTQLIKTLLMKRKDVIVVAPSGKAAQNIDGFTIQSFFGIEHHAFIFNPNNLKMCVENINLLKKTNILLIDEVSMLRCEVIDIVNQEAQFFRKNYAVFGGLRLILFGDMCQLEPVVTNIDRPFLQSHYPKNNGLYYFFNSGCIDIHTLKQFFEIYELQHDFRHHGDECFKNILDEIRQGYCSDYHLSLLNTRALDSLMIKQNYQYLTVSNEQSNKINERFIERLQGKYYCSKPDIKIIYDENSLYKKLNKIPNNKDIILKKNMRIMFINNDSHKNGKRWFNGSMAYIKDITANGSSVISVIVQMEKDGAVIRVFPEETEISYPLNYPDDDTPVVLGKLIQFPFIASYSITIDKSQGLTLDKVFIVLGKYLRDNQLYVALSRVRALNDLLINRPVEKGDIHLSQAMKNFNEQIRENIIPVYHVPANNIVTIVDINNVNTVNFYQQNNV